jgi:predicted CXXCH cytochrome family protein
MDSVKKMSIRSADIPVRPQASDHVRADKNVCVPGWVAWLMDSFNRTLRAFTVLLVAIILAPSRAPAIDPPHATANACAACHILHMSPGGDLTTAAGNANLCMSCHQPGGSASGKPFAAADQALAWPGLPAGATVAGTSHRWDATAAGHVAFLGGAAVASTGTLLPMGVFTGAYSKTYTITITSAGAVGTALFNWAATMPGGGAGNNVLTSTNVLLDQGVSLAFQDGPGTSFQINDQWNLYVRSDLRQPTNAVLLAHMPNGIVGCSTCHDQHSQALTPFDPKAPAYGGSGTGTNRHFMRINNDQDQMCSDCHASRNVTNSLAGSHPVGIPVPVDALHKAPSQLPLAKTTATIACETCHQVHYSPVNDADLQRLTNRVAVCIDCHLQSDTTTPAAHFVATNSATLWPGGRYGSLMPARTNLADRGTCANCHPIHGWPNATNTVSHYPQLLADFGANLCYTCHGTNGPAVKQVQADFAKLYHHPVAASEQKPGRAVGCTDCHNAHMAQSGASVYTNTATATRNQISKPLLGVSGVAVNYTNLGNFVAPPP